MSRLKKGGGGVGLKGGGVCTVLELYKYTSTFLDKRINKKVGFLARTLLNFVQSTTTVTIRISIKCSFNCTSKL